MPAISVSAPGKMILCGEHAVVYGQPAIAIPVNSLVTTTRIFSHPIAPRGEIILISPLHPSPVRLDSLPQTESIPQIIQIIKDHLGVDHLPACEIRISSTLPIAAGLGSSASLSISLINALAQFMGRDLSVAQLNELAYKAEKIHHGNPSGIDNTVICYQKPVYFQRGQKLELLSLGAEYSFILADSGVAASTSEAVTGVKSRWQQEPDRYNGIFEKIGSISSQIRYLLAQGNYQEIGKALTENHSLLREIRVSSNELDHLVEAALNAGAFGAKLSGGGLGGNIFALVKLGSENQIQSALMRAGAKQTWRIELSPVKEDK